MRFLSRRPNLARRNSIVLASCLGALIVFAGIALAPNIYKHRQQHQTIRQLQSKLNRQNDLNVLYRKLETKQTALAELDDGGAAKPQPLQAGEMNRIALTLRKLAAKEGVFINDIRPAIKSGSLPSHQIHIKAVMHGQLEQHRALLFDLLREPYVDGIEQLTFEANGRDITLRLVVAINVV
ncbi:MAG: hypothetical protein OEL66_07285 [Desulfobulbaceae bacterium]|nr:hypothetical protein [Desulfobulbaceae bacterium]